MTKTLVKILSLLLVFSMIFAFASCKNNDETTTTENTQDVGNQSTNADINQNGTSTQSLTDDTNGSETQANSQNGSNVDPTDVNGSTIPNTSPVNGTALPSTNAEILAAYTDVMNFAKTSKVGFKKADWQELPTGKGNIEANTAVDVLIPIAKSFMTKKDEAYGKNLTDKAKGNDMKAFPVVNCLDSGNLLTDVNAIKDAKCEKMSNGNYKITITLKDEYNSEPYNAATKSAPSNVGKMFAPLSSKDIDNTLKNDSTVTKVVRDVNYKLKYMNCKAVLVYNPATKHIVTLDQDMQTFITGTGKLLRVINLRIDKAILYNYTKIWDIKY